MREQKGRKGRGEDRKGREKRRDSAVLKMP